MSENISSAFLNKNLTLKDKTLQRDISQKNKLKPIIHWRNPMLGKFYYLKGLRRKKTENKQQKEWPKKIPLLEENPIFKASRIIPSRTKYYNASEVIPTIKKLNDSAKNVRLRSEKIIYRL